MEPIAGLTVVDRAILHGDVVVRRVASPAGAAHHLAGTVLSTTVTLRHAAPHGGKPCAVRESDAREILPLQPFRVGTFVVRDGWLGRVDSWLEETDLSSPDGTKVGATTVAWVAQCAGATTNPPSAVSEPGDLRPLTAFNHTWWNLSDRGTLAGKLSLIHI